MTLISAYMDLFIRGKSPWGNVRIPLLSKFVFFCLLQSDDEYEGE